MEQLSLVMEVFVRNFCAHADGEESVWMKKSVLQSLLVRHLLPYMVGNNDPAEVIRIMRDLHEDRDGSVDFQEFMSTWTRILVSGHPQFLELVFVTKGPCSPASAALAK